MNRRDLGPYDLNRAQGIAMLMAAAICGVAFLIADFAQGISNLGNVNVGDMTVTGIWSLTVAQDLSAAQVAALESALAVEFGP